jgi:uncharacterized protein YPO0396
MEQEFQDLKKHLSTLLEAQRNIEKCDEQIGLLHPLKKHFEAYNEQAGLAAKSKEQLETARIWRNYTRYHLLDEHLRVLEKEREGWKTKAEDLRQEMEALRDEIRTTQNQLEQNKAGQRLQQLEKEKETLIQQEKEAIAALNKFAGWCKELKLEETEPADEAAYQRIRKDAERTDKRLATEIRNNEEDLFEAQDRQNKTNAQKKQLEAELNVLLQSRNNIPAHLVALRQGICAALNLEEYDLPFAGELMQVRGDELSRQPALEKLLYPFATRMLVPDKHYKKVNKYVNNTDLRARLVYNLVKDHALQQYADDGTVWH